MPLLRHALPAGVLALVAATIAAGLVIRWRTSITLGTPLPPFLMRWAPAVRWPAVIGAVVALGCAAGAPAAIARIRSATVFAAVAYAATAAIGLAVNAARRGATGWSHVFDLGARGSFEARREYLPALAELHRGVAYYVSHYAGLLPFLPTHVKGNPPGPLVVMHLLSITTAGRLTAACVAVGALTAPFAYGLGRSLGGERRGRVAAALAAFSPAIVLFGVTSVDYVFAAMAGAVACLLVSRDPRVRAAGCLAAGIAAFFSWILLAIPVWAVVVALVRDGRLAAARLAAAAIAGIGAVTLVLAATWGYDPVAIVRSLARIYAAGAAAHRPYAFWLLGSPAAWLTMLGVPMTWLFLRSAAEREAAALALAAIVIVSALSGFTKAETERIWLPFVPLACAAAAASPIRRLGLVLALMAVQALAVEVLFGTIW